MKNPDPGKLNPLKRVPGGLEMCKGINHMVRIDAVQHMLTIMEVSSGFLKKLLKLIHLIMPINHTNARPCGWIWVD